MGTMLLPWDELTKSDLILGALGAASLCTLWSGQDLISEVRFPCFPSPAVPRKVLERSISLRFGPTTTLRTSRKAFLRKPIGYANASPHHEWKTFAEWAKEFGPSSFSCSVSIGVIFFLDFGFAGNLISVKVFTQRFILINYVDIAHDLFEKRSSLYSDRTNLPMLNDL